LKTESEFGKTGYGEVWENVGGKVTVFISMGACVECASYVTY